MILEFIIAWLLCSVAFAVYSVPPDVMSVIKCVVAGVLVAIAIFVHISGALILH